MTALCPYKLSGDGPGDAAETPTGGDGGMSDVPLSFPRVMMMRRTVLIIGGAVLLTIFIAVAAISYNNFVAPKMVADLGLHQWPRARHCRLADGQDA